MAKEGKHYRFRSLEFWAERGLIQLIDERYSPKDDKSHDVLTVHEWLKNLDAINAEIPEMKYADERSEHNTLVESGIACAKQAKAQGRPDDPEVIRHMLLHRRRSLVQAGCLVNPHSDAVPNDFSPEKDKLPPVPNHPDIQLSSQPEPQKKQALIT